MVTVTSFELSQVVILVPQKKYIVHQNVKECTRIKKYNKFVSGLYVLKINILFSKEHSSEFQTITYECTLNS